MTKEKQNGHSYGVLLLSNGPDRNACLERFVMRARLP